MVLTRNGTARSCSCETENQVRLEKQASIPSLLLQAASRVSKASNHRMEGPGRDFAGSTARTAAPARLLAPLRASSQFQNFTVCRRLCTIRVHTTQHRSTSSIRKAPSVCSASPISGPVSNSRPLLSASSGCPTTTAPRPLLWCSTTLLDGRIDEPWQPRPSRVRCPHQRRTLRHRVALETLPRPHTPSTSPG